MTNRPPMGADGNAAAAAPSGMHGRPLWLALVLLAATFWLVRVRYEPPQPRPASAPAGQFSATRAEAMLKDTLGQQEPHPVGSAADARVRQAILDELQRLGYQPQVQDAFACSSDGVCAEAQNVLARLDGSEGGKAVLLAAHYDSVPAGPGASDDGAGIAAELEIARALKAGPASRHPVIFLFDEGEEAGLLGAVAFVEQNVWAREVGAVVNLEARGTSGPSLMFETGSHSLWLMPLFARAVSRPLANSLYYAVYRRLPNDTDFSIFRKHGFDGFNFAFIGGVTRYHTPLDNLKNLDPRSLQSQGEHALGVVRALANSNLEPGRAGGAVFFDVAAWKMVWWPVGWTVWLALAAFGLILGCLWLLWRRGTLRGKAFRAGLLAWPLIVAGAGLLAVGLLAALRAAGRAPSNWVAHPSALVAAFWLLGFAVAFGVAAWLGAVAGFEGLWCGTWAWWGATGLAVAFAMPEASFVWVVPALAAGIFGVAMASSDSAIWRHLATAVPGLIAALLTFEIADMLYPAVGATGLPIVAALMAALGAMVGPLIVDAPKLSRRALAVTAFGLTVILVVIAAVLPPYTAGSPQRVTIEFVQKAGASRAEWLVAAESARLPGGLGAAARFSKRTRTPFPWARLAVPVFVAEAKPLSVEGPELQVLDERSDGGRLEVHARLVSPRGAPVVALYFPPNVRVKSFTMQGQTVPPLSRRVLRATNGWQRFVCVTTPADGVEVSFVAEGPLKFDAIVLDESYGLPPEGGKLLRARPADATASQSGDVTVVTRTVTIGPVASDDTPSPALRENRRAASRFAWPDRRGSGTMRSLPRKRRTTR